MKLLKYLLIFVVSIVAIALVAALFVKKEMHTEKEIVIAQPRQAVFDYIKMLKNQNDYSKWAKMDQAMTKTYSGTDGTVGFISAWESKKDDVGKGEQEIKKITEGERIDYELRFIEPFESKAETWMTTTMIDSVHTKVTWGFNGKMSYPFNLMRLFMDVDKSLGDDFETGLTNMKKILEK